MRFSANENFPGGAVVALRGAGHDVFWVHAEMPGAPDDVVLAHAVAEDRVLLTFDKDFGDLVYRLGASANCGILFFRIPTISPEFVINRVMAAIAARDNWSGVFAVVEVDQIRIRPLPLPRME